MLNLITNFIGKTVESIDKCFNGFTNSSGHIHSRNSNNIQIGNMNFQGKTISINNDEIIIDGKTVLKSKVSEIIVNGNVEKVDGVNLTINGNVLGNVDGMNITIKGDVNGNVSGMDVIIKR